MDGLYLVLRSFADMTLDRARAVGRAFDGHSLLRPVKVGGDPARIGVGPSMEAMEALIAKKGLPVDWLTVRRNGKWPAFESGEIQLLHGRGGWTGTQKNGEWEYLLAGHEIKQYWLATTMTETGAVANTVTSARLTRTHTSARRNDRCTTIGRRAPTLRAGDIRLSAGAGFRPVRV
ncbi:MAG TPA: hypothetical protein VI357_22715 [Mycobacteriales bacterium]